METISIQEMAKRTADELWGIDGIFTYAEFIDAIKRIANDVATEQDRIARQEERERCIREAMNAYCGRCSFCRGGECKHKSLIGVETECGRRMMKIRKAMEGGR